MNRRGFLRGLIGGIAITASEPQWPFRIYSFPKDIVLPKFTHVNYGLTVSCQLDKITRKYIIPRLADDIFKPSPIWLHLHNKAKWPT